VAAVAAAAVVRGGYQQAEPGLIRGDSNASDYFEERRIEKERFEGAASGVPSGVG